MAKSDVSDSIGVLDGNDAEEYVETIMSSQRIVRVDTPMGKGRKRQHSAPGSVWGDGSDGEHPGDTPSPRSHKDAKKARHTIAKGPSSPSTGGRLVVTGADVHVSAETTVEQLINKLSTDVHSMFSDMNSRIDKLESGLEQRISKKVAQLLDKRVNAEVSRIKKDVDAQIDSVKDEIAVDIAEIHEKLDSLKLERPSVQPDLSSNIVIRNLPQSSNERIDTKVNGLFRDGLKLGNITLETAERKETRESINKPGVVVATLKSVEDNEKVMTAKNKLKNSRQFSRVYINHDQSRDERLFADNFRAILSAVKKGNTNLTLRGARVIRTGSSPHRNTRDTHELSLPPTTRDSERPRGSNLRSSSPPRSRDNGSRGDRPRGPAGRDSRRSYQGDSQRGRR